MATVGDQIKEPETGWRRYDDTHIGLKYTGSWYKATGANYYNGSVNVTTKATDNNYVTFSFYGTKLRIISDLAQDRHSNNTITVDGVTESFNTYKSGTAVLNAIVYEKMNLPLGLHTVTITVGHNRTNFIMDAIDIDETGYVSGYTLTAPEAGWRRYDDTHDAFSYIGANWIAYSGVNQGLYNNTHHYSAQGKSDNEIRFKFYGTKFRLISSTGNDFADDISVIINGNTEYFSPKMGTSTAIRQQVTYEKLNLPLGIHEVRLLSGTNGNWRLDIDALDIDDTGYMVAQVGQRLTAPELGWKRYDDKTSELKYDGAGWVSATGDSNTYAGTAQYLTLNGATSNNITFHFYGTKIRIIDLYWTNRVNNVTIDIDGVISTWNPNNSSNKYQVLVFEKSGLSKTLHKVKIFTNSPSGIFSIDALDIDSNGRLFHPDEVISVADLEVGKRIRCHYQSSIANTIGTFSGLGEQTSDLIPVASSTTPNGDFYFIMVEDQNGHKLLVADRNIQSSASWDTINASGMVGGLSISLTGLNGMSTSIRLLTGGVNASDTINEWDKYIVNSTLNGKMTAGDNNVWNWSGIYSWTSTTNTNSSNNRTVRGNSSVGTLTNTVPNNVSHGFRPLMEVTILPMYRSFIKYEGSYKKYRTESSTWSTVSTTLPSENTFISEGMGDLSILYRKSTSIVQNMDNTGALGSGKILKSTVSLKKYIEITSLSAK